MKNEIKETIGWLGITSNLYWFTLSWWRYLLSKKEPGWASWWTTIKCRATGHRCGVVWYTSSGLEPDMTCKVCGDDLG